MQMKCEESTTLINRNRFVHGQGTSLMSDDEGGELFHICVSWSREGNAAGKKFV